MRRNQERQNKSGLNHIGAMHSPYAARSARPGSLPVPFTFPGPIYKYSAAVSPYGNWSWIGVFGAPTCERRQVLDTEQCLIILIPCKHKIIYIPVLPGHAGMALLSLICHLDVEISKSNVTCFNLMWSKMISIDLVIDTDPQQWIEVELQQTA